MDSLAGGSGRIGVGELSYRCNDHEEVCSVEDVQLIGFIYQLVKLSAARTHAMQKKPSMLQTPLVSSTCDETRISFIDCLSIKSNSALKRLGIWVS